MNWIRIARTMKDDPRLHAIAAACKVRLAEAVGLVCNVLVELPDHARDGNLSAVPPSALETWARWHGKAGVFDRAFRDALCDEQGTVRAWEKHNGAAIRAADADRERLNRWREQRRQRPANGADTRSETGDETPSETGIKTRDGTGRDETGRSSNYSSSSASARELADVDNPPSVDNSPRDHTGIADRFDDPAHRAAYLAARRGHQHPVTLDAQLTSLVDPITHGPDGTTWAHVGEALADLLGNNQPLNLRALRGYVRKAKQAPPPEWTGEGPKPRGDGTDWLDREIAAAQQATERGAA